MADFRRCCRPNLLSNPNYIYRVLILCCPEIASASGNSRLGRPYLLLRNSTMKRQIKIAVAIVALWLKSNIFFARLFFITFILSIYSYILLPSNNHCTCLSLRINHERLYPSKKQWIFPQWEPFPQFLRGVIFTFSYSTVQK